MRVTRADWAATCPWDGIIGKPAFPGGPEDIGQLQGAGFANKQVPVWSTALGKFIPANISGIAGYLPPSGGGGSVIQNLDTPGVATRKQPNGLPYGPTQDVWFRDIFNIRQYGASAADDGDDSGAWNRAIVDLTAAGGGCLYCPAGDYSLFGLTEITVPILILGDGIGVTNLTFADVEGISASTADADDGYMFGLQGLSIVSNGSSSFETAVALTNGSAGVDASLLISQIEFRGPWARCVDANGFGAGGRITGLFARGTSHNDRMVRLSGCNDVAVDNSRFFGANVGRAVAIEDGSQDCDVIDNKFRNFTYEPVLLESGVERCRVYNRYVNCPDPPVDGDDTVNELGDLWPARSDRLGLVKIGSGVDVDSDGTISVTNGSGGGGGVFSGAKAIRTTTQGISDNTDTLISWQSTEFDSDAYWSAGSPTKFTIPETGYYHLSTSISFQANATGVRALTVLKNTSNTVATSRVQAGTSGFVTIPACNVDLHLAAGDFIEVQVYQPSGVSLDVQSGPGGTFLSIFKIN